MTRPPGSFGPATREAIGDLATVSEAPPWELRERPTWGLAPGDAIAPGRTVLRELGGGRRYEVFLVWDDHRLSVLVAKLLRPDHAGDPAALRELAQEGEVLARLAHPVLVRGFDVVAEGRFPHLLIEHLEGPTLRELIDRDGALPPEQLLPLGLHVASALHYLAAEGMVHLDVKPDNVVMGAPPRLIDLSVACTVEAAARLRRPVGTDGYMAPEQCDASFGPIGPPADVFGLAATLHHAAGGTRPFARDGEQRFPQLERPPAPLPRRVPAELAELVGAALAREPAARPTAAELAAGLEPLVARLPRRPLRRK
ncbi:MAG TPA: serine/threonine-protein kinase [Solirubrobacteraceae bacterium]|nr:serine/threonine-protein kinase [Solirubrobacteraceae bacterium]